MTILTIATEVAALASLIRPVSISSGDETTLRILSAIHQAGDDVVRRGDWTTLLATLQATARDVALPADFKRLQPGGSALVSNLTGPLRGALSSDQWATLGILGATGQSFFTITNGAINISRALSVGEIVNVNYISNYWITNVATGSAANRATGDNDLVRIPESLVTKGAVWRYRRDRGLPWQDQMQEWEADLAAELNSDRGVTA